MYIKWIQERLMDEYLLVKRSQEHRIKVLANLHINVKPHGCIHSKRNQKRQGFNVL
jgi:hypothetical protein